MNGTALRTPMIMPAACVAAVMTVAIANGQCQYEVTIIEPPPAPPPFTNEPFRASAINDSGTAVGSYTNGVTLEGEGFIWTADTGVVTMTRPPGVYSLSPSDISDSGVICGTWWTHNSPGGRRGWVYWPDTQTYTELDTVTGDGWSMAHAINNDNIVVGERSTTDSVSPRNAYVWSPDDGFTDLGPLTGDDWSRAAAISDDGTVVGTVGFIASNGERAFSWDGHSLVTLPPVGNSGISSSATGISLGGSVSGSGLLQDDGGQYHRSFFWRNGGFTILPPLLPEYEIHGFRAGNDVGLGVGVAIDADNVGNRIAIMGTYADVIDLNTLLSPPNPDLDLRTADGVNNAGQILANGRLPDRQVAVALTPLNANLADLNTDCQVDVFDLLELLQLWETDLPQADLDNSGQVNVFDLLILLSNWG